MLPRAGSDRMCPLTLYRGISASMVLRRSKNSFSIEMSDACPSTEVQVNAIALVKGKSGC